jgi:hypothetical protein
MIKILKEKSIKSTCKDRIKLNIICLYSWDYEFCWADFYFTTAFYNKVRINLRSKKFIMYWFFLWSFIKMHNLLS